jgi:hypothetical protein
MVIALKVVMVEIQLQSVPLLLLPKVMDVLIQRGPKSLVLTN